MLRTLNRSQSPSTSHVPVERDAARLTCGISPRFLATSRARAPGRDDRRFTSPIRARGFAPGTPLAFTPGRYVLQARTEGRMTERRVFDVPKDPKDQVRIFITMAKKAAE